MARFAEKTSTESVSETAILRDSGEFSNVFRNKTYQTLSNHIKPLFLVRVVFEGRPHDLILPKKPQKSFQLPGLYEKNAQGSESFFALSWVMMLGKLQ